jgi:hypothetical protein
MSIYEPHLCQTYWGSHGCRLPRDHDGSHRCDDHSEIDREGRDEGGFQWYMYGEDAPPSDGDLANESGTFTITFRSVGPISRAGDAE